MGGRHGCRQSRRACLLTLVDRKNGFLVGGKRRRKTAKCIRDKMPRALEGQPLGSVTLDRGKEFADHARVTDEILLFKFN